MDARKHGVAIVIGEALGAMLKRRAWIPRVVERSCALALGRNVQPNSVELSAAMTAAIFVEGGTNNALACLNVKVKRLDAKQVTWSALKGPYFARLVLKTKGN